MKESTFLKARDSYQCEFESEPIYLGIISGTSIISKNTEILLFPNPVRDILNIETANQRQISQISIYDISGRRIFEAQPNVSQYNVESRLIGNGLYFIHITSDNQTIVNRFVILD